MSTLLLIDVNSRGTSLKQKYASYIFFIETKIRFAMLATKIIKNISIVIFGVMACRHLVSLYLLTHLSKLRFVIISTDTISASSSYYTPNSFQMLFEPFQINLAYG